MRRQTLGMATLVLGLGLAAACKGPALPSPLTGQSRYLCCNLHFEKDEISDAGYQVGTLIPFGTRVQILEVRKRSVKFQPAGYPALTLKYEYNAEGGLPFETYLDRLFVTDDPRLRFAARPTPAPARKGKGKAHASAAPATPASRLKLIEAGGVEPGMTKEEVLTSLGYPPAHRTPSLDASDWHYWQNRWHQFVVYFDGDRVSRVQQ
ncbi:MAG TPA: outer membrane protein assembly factor BamE [Candidatus Binatia bacterium]|nr:outer membrane protein assembly factor BamE [Candidatus Binatia bacterium]